MGREITFYNTIVGQRFDKNRELLFKKTGFELHKKHQVRWQGWRWIIAETWGMNRVDIEHLLYGDPATFEERFRDLLNLVREEKAQAKERERKKKQERKRRARERAKFIKLPREKQKKILEKRKRESWTINVCRR